MVEVVREAAVVERACVEVAKEAAEGAERAEVATGRSPTAHRSSRTASRLAVSRCLAIHLAGPQCRSDPAARLLVAGFGSVDSRPLVW